MGLGPVAVRKGTFTEELLKYFLEHKAATMKEAAKHFGKSLQYVAQYFRQLEADGFIKRSDRTIQSPRRKCSRLTVFGLTMKDIRQKENQLLENVSDEGLLNGLNNIVYNIFKSTNKAFTPYAMLLEVQKEKPSYDNLAYIGTIMRELWKNKELGISRSPFRIPPNCLELEGRRGAYIYSTDPKQIKRKVLELAPKEVADCYNRITREDKVFASFYLKKLTGISISEDDDEDHTPLSRTWLINKFHRAGWIGYKSYKSMGYFFNKHMPKDVVEQSIRELHQKSCEYRLGTMELGRISEKRALFVFTMWAKLKWKKNLVLPDGFPKNVPNWFNKKHIEQYTHKDKAPNGREKTFLDCSVWKFDKNPLDYLLIEKTDDLLNIPPSGFALNMKYTQKAIGDYMLTNMIHSLKQGYLYRSRLDKETGKKRARRVRIPENGFLRPVILCKSTMGQTIWEYVKDYGCLVITLPKLRKMEQVLKEEFGIEYGDSKKAEEMMERVRLFEYYQQHAYELGKDAVAMAKEAVPSA